MIATNNDILDQLSKQFEELQSNLECYLNPTEELNVQLVSSSKIVFDQMKSQEVDSVIGAAPKQLLTRGFESEQIWQQLNLQNVGILKVTKRLLHNFDASDITFNDSEVENFEDKEEETEDDEEEQDNFQKIEKDLSSEDDFDDEDLEEDEIDFLDEDIEEEDNDNSNNNNKKSKTYKTSVVDDKFFKLRQLEEFLDQQDKLEEIRRDNEGQNVGDNSDDNDDDVDLFAEGESGSESKFGDGDNLMYKDFFDPPPEVKADKKPKENKKKVTFQSNNETNKQLDEKVEEESEDDMGKEKDTNPDNDDTKKTVFERRQEEIKKKISKLEDANISTKPWQLIGETTSKARPMNSLLEEHVTFDHTSVGTPVITEETTTSIEDIIKKRIRDQAWDDVERKVKPTIQPHEYKRAPELNMEKSKLSLAEVYEKEYLKQMEDDKEEKENEDHVTINKLMDRLFIKLDALSNFYFTPKPPKPDIKIITNTPSLQMEEVTPITMTTASQMAPEEIFEKKKGEVLGDDEKTAEDRKRQRRQKKIKKRFAAQEKEKKEAMKVKTSGKTTKRKAVEQLKKGVRNTLVSEQQQRGEGNTTKNLTSSTQFFNKLQDEVTKKISDHKSKNDGPSKRKKQKTQHLKL